MRFAIALTMLGLALCGCRSVEGGVHPTEGLVSKDTGDDLAACSLSFSLSQSTLDSLGVVLEAEGMTFAGKLSSRFESGVRNTVLNDPAISDDIKARFLDHYFSCIDKRLEARLSEPTKRVLAVISRSQRLWNRWAEAVESASRSAEQRALPAGAANEFALAGNELSAISDSDLQPRFQLMKHERAALMYMLAAETLIRFGDKSPGQRNAAIEHSQKALAAAERARGAYVIVARAPSEAITNWLIDSEVQLKTVNRLTDVRAQLVYLGQREQVAALEADLETFDCEYIRTYMMEDAVYKRIEPIKKFQACQDPAKKAAMFLFAQSTADDAVGSKSDKGKNKEDRGGDRGIRERDEKRRRDSDKGQVIRPPIDVQKPSEPATEPPPAIRPPIDLSPDDAIKDIQK